MQQLDQIVQRYKERAEKAEAETESLKKTLEMERELYVNIRELLKKKERDINTLKDAYNMQIDLVKALEGRIEKLEKNI